MDGLTAMRGLVAVVDAQGHSHPQGGQRCDDDARRILDDIEDAERLGF